MLHWLGCLVCVVSVAPISVANGAWPDFRGPGADGHVPDNDAVNLPTEWGENVNVVWKTPIPHVGWSTPAILEGRIWLTSADKNGHDYFVLCVDEASGEIVFNKHLFHSDNPEPLGNTVNCYASPSPVVEPGRVYVHFGSYGTACLDAETKKVLWQRTDLPCRHFRGPGSSPVLDGDRLILTMEGVDRQYMVALDTETGENVWRTDRSVDYNDLDENGEPRAEGDYRKGFSTPIFITDGNGVRQMVSAGSKAAYGYDPISGEELWRFEYAAHTPAVRPVYGDEVLYLATGHGSAEMVALRIEGRGVLGEDAIIWRHRKNVAETASPLLVDGLLYMVADNGVLTCLDAETGAPVWQTRAGGSFAASLLYANGRVYSFDRQALATVFEAGEHEQILAKNELDAGMMASPAVSDGSLILRTITHLYRISNR